jgi:radical SAM superfamily enzyme YgiQ (UPF0313 family)
VNVLLIASYEMGRQPFGLASPAAWLHALGPQIEVACLDLFVQRLDEDAVARADLIAFYLPMHTATRIAAAVLPRVRRLNARAHIACFGLYAPLNAPYLRELGAQSILGGEFEQGLADLALRLQAGEAAPPAPPEISLARQRFLVPDRRGLPALGRYARLHGLHAEPVLSGYTEASRGCKHLCRHCPVVPVYGGRFRIVDAEVVLADIARQVEAGARHITFGDPDFFNGPTHALRLTRALHERFPSVSYDVTIKVEHLLKHARELPALRASGCVLVTSAVESVDDAVLARLEKGHTRADFVRAVELMREVGLPLQPTFVTFTPWITPEGYLELLALLDSLGLVESLPPIQLAIRLLLPHGSRLLELDEVRQLVGPFDPAALAYPWHHPDRRVDALHEAVLGAVKEGSAQGLGRRAIFARAWELAEQAANAQRARSEAKHNPLASKPVPWLSEPWYC